MYPVRVGNVVIVGIALPYSALTDVGPPEPLLSFNVTVYEFIELGVHKFDTVLLLAFHVAVAHADTPVELGHVELHDDCAVPFVVVPFLHAVHFVAPVVLDAPVAHAEHAVPLT